MRPHCSVVTEQNKTMAMMATSGGGGGGSGDAAIRLKPSNTNTPARPEPKFCGWIFSYTRGKKSIT